MEPFYMKIIMRRDSVIFYIENNRIDNAIRRCLLNKTKPFYLELVWEKYTKKDCGFQQSEKGYAPDQCH